MRKMVCAGIVAVSLCTAAAGPAKAWGGGGGVLFGTAIGLTAGAVIGSALVHPYPYVVAPPPYAYPPSYVVAPPPPYGYPLAYGYPPVYYGYPAPYAYPPPYPRPYGYAYAPPWPRPASGYAPSGYPAAPGYAAAAPVRAPDVPACRTGQFFNTLTGTCDRR